MNNKKTTKYFSFLLGCLLISNPVFHAKSIATKTDCASKMDKKQPKPKNVRSGKRDSKSNYELAKYVGLGVGSFASLIILYKIFKNKHDDPKTNTAQTSEAEPSSNSASKKSAEGSTTANVGDVKFRYNESLKEICPPIIFSPNVVNHIEINEEARKRIYSKNAEVFKPRTIYSPEQILQGITEENLRDNPREYFFQDETGYCYLKIDDQALDMVNFSNLIPVGLFSIVNLENLKQKAHSNSGIGNGKLKFVYSKGGKGDLTRACDLLSVTKWIDNPFLQSQGVASNFNAIETTGSYNFNKKLSSYPGDPTQGPRAMQKAAGTSLFLLHVVNGKKRPVEDSNGFRKFFSQESDMNAECQWKLNLLEDFGLKTSAGYLKKDIKNDEKIINARDNQFNMMVVLDAPVPLRDAKNGGFTHCEDGHNLTFTINACFPSSRSSYGTTNGVSDDAIKAHLRRHYLSHFYFYKLAGIEFASIPMIGSGVFGVEVGFHTEILQEEKISNALKNCGATIIINGFSARTGTIKTEECEALNLQEVYPSINELGDLIKELKHS